MTPAMWVQIPPDTPMPYKDKEKAMKHNRDYCKKHYASNKQRYIAKSKIRRKRVVTEFQASKLGKPCVDCRGIFPPVAMDYDHVIGTKENGVSALVRDASSKRVIAEIAKCELVCACCHRIRTAKRIDNVAVVW